MKRLDICLKDCPKWFPCLEKPNPTNSWDWSDWGLAAVGHPRNATEGKWTLGGGIKVLFMSTFYVLKKNKTKLRNKLKRSL